MARIRKLSKVGNSADLKQGTEPAVDQSESDQDVLSKIGLLLETVESELVPRLLINQTNYLPVASSLLSNPAVDPQPGSRCTQDKIESLTNLCIDSEPRKLDQYIADLLTQGIKLESIYLYLLAPTARQLGELWSSDHLSFVDVQLGLSRLHQLICECDAVGYCSDNIPMTQQSILLTCAPGESHTFGITMVADFFRRYGWRVSNFCGHEKGFLLARLASTQYTAVGFSLHNDISYQVLKSLVREVRRKSISKDLMVLVGGDFFVRNPDKVDDVGADLFARDARQAVLQACSLSKQSE